MRQFVVEAHPEDRGIVYLIDDRFQRAAVRERLPSWWQVTPAPCCSSLQPGG